MTRIIDFGKQDVQVANVRPFEHPNAHNASSPPPLELLAWLHRPSPRLLGLASVRAPAFDLLVAAQARTQADIDSWWCAESEALRHLDKIQLVHIED